MHGLIMGVDPYENCHVIPGWITIGVLFILVVIGYCLNRWYSILLLACNWLDSLDDFLSLSVMFVAMIILGVSLFLMVVFLYESSWNRVCKHEGCSSSTCRYTKKG